MVKNGKEDGDVGEDGRGETTKKRRSQECIALHTEEMGERIRKTVETGLFAPPLEKVTKQSTYNDADGGAGGAGDRREDHDNDNDDDFCVFTNLMAGNKHGATQGYQTASGEGSGGGSATGGGSAEGGSATSATKSAKSESQ